MKICTLVSVIIPIRNEARHIAECINSVIAQTYPKEFLEILLIDGMSEDNTREIIHEYLIKYPFLKLLDNPEKIVPTALNTAIKASRGDVIIRMDAHTFYDKDYIFKCVETLNNIDAHNVGGPIVTLPGDDTLKAKAIALATSQPFGVGNSKFRTSAEAQYVDTVPFGAFRREVFEKVGLFNENLPRNQDIEFNSRIRKFGLKIFLNPEIKSFYYNRADYSGLWKQNYINGKWNIYTHAISHNPLSIRHYVPLFFILSIFVGLVIMLINRAGVFLTLSIIVSYVLINIFFSLKAGLTHGLRIIPALSLSFFVLHFSYGIGSLWGLLKVGSWKNSLKAVRTCDI